MLVDAHAHLLPRDYPADAPECFPRMEPIDGDTARLHLFGASRFQARTCSSTPSGGSRRWTPPAWTPRCSRPMPPLLRYDLPPADGLSLARHVNEFTATLCAADPERLIGFGMVPMQDPEAATAELTAIRDQRACYGVEIASNVLGRLDRRRALPAVLRRGGAAGPAGLRARDAVARPTGCPRSAMGTYVVGLEGALAAASHDRRWHRGRSARTCGSPSATRPAASR